MVVDVGLECSKAENRELKSRQSQQTRDLEIIAALCVVTREGWGTSVVPPKLETGVAFQPAPFDWHKRSERRKAGAKRPSRKTARDAC